MVVKCVFPFLVVVGLLVCTASASALSYRPAGITAADTPLEAATAFVEQRPALVDGADVDQLVPAGQERGLAGLTVVRYDQEINGVPVLGASVVVGLRGDRRVVAASGETLDAPLPAIGPSISSADARTAALRHYEKSMVSGLQAREPSLVVYAPSILGEVGGAAVLAWRVPVTNGSDVADDAYIDATSGRVVKTISAIETAANRVVCDAANTNAKYPCTSPFDATEANPPIVPGDVWGAFAYAGATWDMYAALGRNSIDNAGMTLTSTVRWTPDGAAFANAYWDGEQMVYGAGYASALDVVAHELTHGVTDYTSQLIYAGQSGAINEAMSDIMGELTEHSQPSHPSAWLLGEDLPGGAIRSMENPPAFGDPDAMDSTHYYVGNNESVLVHTNSGVGNKTAFLIAAGGVFNGQTVTGIGVAKSARLWYQTNLLLRSAAGFADLADALDQACASLVGTNGFSASDCAQVAAAETATKLRIPAPNAAAVPVLCTSRTPTDVFNDSFAGGASNWTIARTLGPDNAWYPSTVDAGDGVSSHWPLATSTSIRGTEPVVRTDSTIAMTSSVIVPTDARFRFVHHYDFETTVVSGNLSNYDGDLVEYSVDGGSWTDAGGLPSVNGYNGVLDATGDSAGSTPTLVGRQTFVGASAGAVTTQYDLSALAGHAVRFRFRVSTDDGNANTPEVGWFIGSARVFGCGSGATPTSPAASLAAPETSAAAPAIKLPPSTGTWTVSRATDTVLVLFLRQKGTTYVIKAQRKNVVRMGVCRAIGTRVKCSINAPAGTWRVTVTPRINGTTGKPIVQTVRT